jgi:hypothetical protein
MTTPSTALLPDRILLAVRNGVGVTGISHDSELFLYHNNNRNPQVPVQTLKDLLRLVEPEISSALTDRPPTRPS